MELKILLEDQLTLEKIFIINQITDIENYRENIDKFFKMETHKVLMLCVFKSEKSHEWLDVNLYRQKNNWKESMVKLETLFPKSKNPVNLLPRIFSIKKPGIYENPELESVIQNQFDDIKTCGFEMLFPITSKYVFLKFLTQYFQYFNLTQTLLDSVHIQTGSADIDWDSLFDNENYDGTEDEILEYFGNQIIFAINFFKIPDSKLYAFFSRFTTENVETQIIDNDNFGSTDKYDFSGTDKYDFGNYD